MAFQSLLPAPGARTRSGPAQLCSRWEALPQPTEKQAPPRPQPAQSHASRAHRTAGRCPGWGCHRGSRSVALGMGTQTTTRLTFPCPRSRAEAAAVQAALSTLRRAALGLHCGPASPAAPGTRNTPWGPAATHAGRETRQHQTLCAVRVGAVLEAPCWAPPRARAHLRKERLPSGGGGWPCDSPSLPHGPGPSLPRWCGAGSGSV